MMMLNTKIGVTFLALVAGTASAASNKNDGGADRRRQTRRLRKGRRGENARIATRNHNKALDNDITEDVAFWTRSLQQSIPPRPPTPPPPTPQLRPTPKPTPFPTSISTDPQTPNPTDPQATPNPTDFVETPNPTDPQTPPPVPSPPSNTPVANPDSANVSAGADAAFVSVLVNDTPAPGESLVVQTITKNADNGACSIGLALDDVVYEPKPDFVGVDTCDYEACDSVSACDTATVTFTVG